MSSLIVEVCRVDGVTKHPNADAMELVQVKGWQVCAKINDFKVGDKCIYFPPDSILTGPLADRLGVAKYLHPLPKDVNGERPAGGRIRVAKLRGVASYGLIMREIDDPEWEVGTDVAAFYGVTKWDPPPENADGDAEREDAAFHKYTNVENYRNFPNLFVPGEEVLFTEKIHGMNARVGLITLAEGPTWMAGSHGVRRREFDRLGRRSKFWDVLTDNVKELLTHVAEGTKNVVMFGEIYGSGVQDMTYSLTQGVRTWRAFDITVNGNYLDFDRKAQLCAKFGVEMVPILYRGPFSSTIVEEYCTGPTTVCDPSKAGKHNFREGIIISPTKERYARELGGDGRLILKAINPDYLMRKDGTEFR